MSSPCEDHQSVRDRDAVIDNLQFENMLLRNEVMRLSGQQVVDMVSSAVLNREVKMLREDNADLLRRNRQLRIDLGENLQERLRGIINRAKGVNHDAIHGEESYSAEDLDIADQRAGEYADRYQLREDMGY